MKIIMSLCLIVNHPHILLGKKKIGFGQGKWLCGFGGRLEAGETIEQTAVREVREEAGIEVLELKKSGVYEVRWQDNQDIHEIHVFKVLNYSGQPGESDEMAPQWFNLNDLPINMMWPDAKYWLPLFFDDKNFNGKFLYNKDNQVVDFSFG